MIILRFVLPTKLVELSHGHGYQVYYYYDKTWLEMQPNQQFASDLLILKIESKQSLSLKSPIYIIALNSAIHNAPEHVFYASLNNPSFYVQDASKFKAHPKVKIFPFSTEFNHSKNLEKRREKEKIDLINTLKLVEISEKEWIDLIQ